MKGGVDSNLYTDADVIYSTRQYFGWANALFKITRSTDFNTAYVFFDSNGVISQNSLISTTSNTTPDATTLVSWASGGNMSVEEWYGQTPDGLINIDKVVTPISAKPFLSFTGTSIRANT